MHIQKSYTGPQAVADLTGPLGLPPLKNRPDDPNDPKFIEELNREGVYVHKLSTEPDSLKKQLQKIKENRIPTPATFVGVGIHRTYSHWRWKNTSGLVFGPETISLLSYKGDIASYRLPNGKTFADFGTGSKADQYLAYSKHLSNTFNTFGETITAFNNRKPKKLILVENAVFSKSKSQEIDARSNLAFLRSEVTGGLGVQDVASKHLISRILQNINKSPAEWTKVDLLAELEARCEKDVQLAAVLGHAIIKIRMFHDDLAVQRYLQRGAEPPAKIGHYINQIRDTGAQTPDEHLTMPELGNILGVCVNFESVSGVDQALEINAKLKEEQKSCGSGEKNHPALHYQISIKKGRSVSRAGWSQHIIPWSSAGLKDFARTGQVTGIDGRRFPPNHFKVINLIAETGSLVAFETQKKLHGCLTPQNFVGDLSRIKDGTENLLHMAIKARCSLETVKLFYFWNVDAFKERDSNNDTAFDIATKRKLPCLEFLTSAKNWNDRPTEFAKHRDIYISEQLQAIKKPESAFGLRTGKIETGGTAYIPELGTYRVVLGTVQIREDDDALYEGIQKYCPDLGDMEFTLGTKRTRDTFDTIGTWTSATSGSATEPKLLVGIQHIKPGTDAHGQPVIEKIVLVDNTRTVTCRMILAIREETNLVSKIEVESGPLRDGSPESFDTDSASYFKSLLFVPTEHVASIRKNLESKKLPNIDFGKMEIDNDIRARERDITHAKYILANIHWLRAWKTTIASYSSEEQKYITDLCKDFHTDVDTKLADRIWLLKEQIRKKRMGLVSTLVKPDRNGDSLLHAIVTEINKTNEPDEADIKLSLGMLLEDQRARSDVNLQLARRMYEDAAQHRHGMAEYALARFHNEGLGGLPKNAFAGSACMQRAADLGVVKAKDWVKAEAERLAKKRADELAATAERNRRKAVEQERERNAMLTAQAELRRLESERAAAIKAARSRWERFTHKVEKMLHAK